MSDSNRLPRVLFSIVTATLVAGLAGACASRDYYDDGPGDRRVTRRWSPERSVVEERVIVVDSPPPPPRVETVIVRPSYRHVWIAGHWRPVGRRWDWVPGHWSEPPRGRHLWEAPRYEHRGREYVWVDGRWL